MLHIRIYAQCSSCANLLCVQANSNVELIVLDEDENQTSANACEDDDEIKIVREIIND